MPAKRLFIIDAMAMAFRNYHAFGVRPLTTSAGLPTSAIFGSAIFLLKLIEDEAPDYLVVATDSKEPTFRHELYKEYKANRTLMPQDLSVQIPYLFRLFEALGCRLLRKSGVEADDLIGSLVKKVSSPELHSYIVSGDKDFLQLVNDHIFLYSPRKAEAAHIVNKNGVREKFGCDPHQVIDLLALIGDTSDNIPGVSGIGEKGATLLIEKYGSLDGIYAHLDEITNKRQRDSLQANRDMAYLSKQLVTIDINIPLDVEIHDMIFDKSCKKRPEALIELFRELEFRSLIDKINANKIHGQTGSAVKSTTPVSPLEVLPSVAKSGLETFASHRFKDQESYILANNPEKFNQLLQALEKADEYSFDTETTGLDVISDKPIGLGFAVAPARGFYVPLVEKHLDGMMPHEILEKLKPYLYHPRKLKIGHNLKFDLQMMSNIGIKLLPPFADTMICSYLLDSIGREHGLDATCLRLLNYEKIPTSALIGPKGKGAMLDVELSLLSQYCIEDVDLTLRLYHCFLPKLREQGLLPLFSEIEMPLVPILAEMEQAGVYIDTEALNDISHLLDERAKSLEKVIFQQAGEEFNIHSPKQLQVILFEKLKVHEKLGIKRLKKTQSGFSTDVSVLDKLSGHPLPRAILEYRTVTKLKNTYVDTLPQLVNPKSGRIHTSFHQTGTATGRLSSSDPNLQNIPIKSDLGKEIRRAFSTQAKDHVIISADYSQIELRLLAHLAKEQALVDAFSRSADIHTETAARIFAINPQDVTPRMRTQAKAINFGIIYGMGSQRLARETGVSVEEAKRFIEKYFLTYPSIGKYIDDAIANARKRGYTVTMTGRKRAVPELRAKEPQIVSAGESIAVNSPVQGSASDLIKMAMIKVRAALQKHVPEALMLLQVHDELVFECPTAKAEQAKQIIKENMESAMKLNVPLVVEVGAGPNWLEAH